MALAPLKQIPMNLFIMYMAGNTISIFPAMMVCMMGWRPLQALMSLSASEYNPMLQLHVGDSSLGVPPRPSPAVSQLPSIPVVVPSPASPPATGVPTCPPTVIPTTAPATHVPLQ